MEESARMMAEHTIMSVDKSTLTPPQKRRYAKEQQKILDRMDAEDEAKRL